MRPDGRAFNELRTVSVEPSPNRYAEGSALIRVGETHVLCTVSVQDGVESWLKGQGRGWLTAEYALLPRSTHTRTSRRHTQGGRAQEIRRLIGRSLRRAVDLTLIGERTLIVDCDVLQAAGGTRTTSIIGGYIAVALAVHTLISNSTIAPEALLPPIAATSVGMVNGQPCLDLAYEEDAGADMDLNVVMDAAGGFVEVQGTAEKTPVGRKELNSLLDLATFGIEHIISMQREVLTCAGINV
ncbi:MAG: ribonuclease PH [Anaerolineae bacterium]|nr:ribonuclease PH [Anaerolineae bacterium]